VEVAQERQAGRRRWQPPLAVVGALLGGGRRDDGGKLWPSPWDGEVLFLPPPVEKKRRRERRATSSSRASNAEVTMVALCLSTQQYLTVQRWYI
jgi:hypothetical protein